MVDLLQLSNLTETFDCPKKPENQKWAIDYSRQWINGAEQEALQDIRSQKHLDLYALAKRSGQREILQSQLLKLLYPQTYAIVARSLTEVTGIVTRDRPNFSLNMDWFYRFAKDNDITDDLSHEHDYIFTARTASESSYAMRAVSSDELSKKLGLTSGMEPVGNDFGVYEPRLRELNEFLSIHSENEPDLRQILINRFSENTLQHHDICGAQIYITSVRAFDKILKKIQSLPGAWAMHKTGLNGQETGNRVLTPDDVEKGYGVSVLKKITESTSSLPVYSSVHLTFPDRKQLLREVRMRFLDPEQSILRTDMANSRAIRKRGILNIGLSEKEVATLTGNAKNAAEKLTHTSKII